MTKYLFTFLITAVYALPLTAQLKPSHNLSFPALAKRWDEAIPLGNGVTGALIWEKNGRLRFSLDRVDLWDEREALHLEKYTYKWVEQQVLNKQYDTVQRALDEPYEASAYPTKLPGAAIEFDISSFGEVQSNVLDLATARNTVKFRNGTEMSTYIDALQPVGWFVFSNVTDKAWEPQLLIPNYNTGASGSTGNSVDGLGLERLGYEKGTVTKTPGKIIYHQPISEGKYYEVMVWWEHIPGNKVLGKWTISNNEPALELLRNETASGSKHNTWWFHFWERSAISIPDTLLETQYYREMYKLGAVARKGAPAISLQAVWTADNGNLPPWKGDFHNDLNTQLSYWPAYTGNHLTEAATFTDWLWKTRAANQKMTQQYFGVKGLNVPGVETINGYPMGGWIQYSLSPTTGAWVSQHFYWQWKYSMDDKLLKEKVYPYIHETATFLENITLLKNGKRKLPLSSSPEYHDNSIKAWYLNWTNYDLSLAHFLFKAAAEVSNAAGKTSEAKHWKAVLEQLPTLDTNETGLTVAPGENLGSSHRHFSPYMSIYPLALLDDQTVIKNSLRHIEKLGTRAWVGYSFTWLACLYARANEADSAVKQLQIFASNFCSPNSFHLNGDQKNGQYSSFTYRPFTLEGNFAFAQGIHELLLRTKDGVIEVFPAVPDAWKDISFKGLRAEGAFIIDAEKKDGAIKIKIRSEKENLLKIKLPGGVTQYKMSAGQVKEFDFKG
ncbi:hypothetical protein GFS24_04940 [Chitinophaga sp. SYP-B3965]|uniref:glycosyl hydrolase family 95 catalytic domain-containing protein n=1 Tax=Chitinophaga sp. SYP-B3965 TaxID=2663120 RepID=UPI001299ED07|nr:hypothetical protein [Chitinophaga sp. SYP-B3965]MRG44445.1 hypothetical protein [Chitinophaga sp. SYP-B3965]